MISYTLEDAHDVLDQILDNQKKMLKMRGSDMITKTQSIAYFLEINTKYIENKELLANVAQGNQIDQIVVYDEDLNVIAISPTPKNFVPKKMKLKDCRLGEQHELIYKIIKDKRLSFFLDIDKGIVTGKPAQISAAPFKKKPGGILIENNGYFSKKSIDQLINVSHLSRAFRVAKLGHLLISDAQGNIVCSAYPGLQGQNFINYFGIDKWNEICIGMDQAQKAFDVKKISYCEGYLFDKMHFVKGKNFTYCVLYYYLPFLREKHSTLYMKQGEQEYYDEQIKGKPFTDWYIIAASIPIEEIHASRNQVLYQFTLLYVILFLVTFFTVSRLTQKLAINGIRDINHSLKKITEGNLNEMVSVRTCPEFVMLSNGINSMVDSMKKSNQIRLKQAVQEREFNLARQIQLAVMPNVFPPFPERKDFDIYAMMQTTEIVGGDFYDFILLDKDHLAFTIADVSGKGFPAALFMMRSKIFSRMLISSGVPIDEVIFRTNNYLTESNSIGMFVTKFTGILELSSGIFTYINAGHPSPILLSKKNKTVSLLDAEINNYPMMGLIKDINYKVSTLFLDQGDRLLLYTDGITEAENHQEELFGINRLLNFLKNDPENNTSLKDLLEQINQEIIKFENGRAKNDDMTMMAIDYKKS